MTLVQRLVEVMNKAGIHARPAAMIVKVANRYQAGLYMEKDDMKINGKSIMGIITLGATYKSRLIISTEGPAEEEAAAAIEQLFLNRVEE